MPGGEGLFDAGPCGLEPGEQGRSAAVAQAHPEKSSGVAIAVGEVKEIFVL